MDKKADERSFLIVELKRFASVNGRAPMIKEWRNNQEYPSASRVLKEFGKWNVGIKAAGLDTNEVRYSREDLLNAIRGFRTQHGRAPKASEFVAADGWPPASSVLKMFGTWNKGLGAAGLDLNRERYSREKIIDAFQSFALENGRSPTAKDGDIVDYLPPSTTVASHFGTWNTALNAAGLDLNNQEFTKQDVKAAFERFLKERGRPPKVDDPDEVDYLPGYGAVRRLYGSWPEACIQTGVTKRKPRPTKARIIKDFKALAKSLGRTPVITDLDEGLGPFTRSQVLRTFDKSYRTLVRAAGFEPVSRTWTDEEILEAARILKRRLGRTPYGYEFANHADMPDPSMFTDRFGSYETALRLADVTPGPDYDLWRRWQRLVGDIVLAVYGPYEKNKVDGIDGLVDFYISSKRLVIDAMTSAYKAEQKTSEIKRYLIPGHRLEFWCLMGGNEYKVNGLTYLYPADVIALISGASHVPVATKEQLILQVRNRAADRPGDYSTDELLEVLTNFVASHGRRPKFRDFADSGDYPSPSTYSRYFGSWTNALAEAGLFDPTIEHFNGKLRPLSAEEAIAEVTKLGKELGRLPTRKQATTALGCSARHLWSAFGTWGALLKAVRAADDTGIFNKRKLRKYGLTPEEITDAIHRYVAEYGRVPQQRDWDGLPGYPGAPTAAKVFGSWTAAVRAAGFLPAKGLTADDVKAHLQVVIEKHGSLTGDDYEALFQANRHLHWPHLVTITRKLKVATFDEAVRLVRRKA